MTNIIFGLGNPGIKYEKSRHNLGFMIVDALVSRRGGTWQVDKRSKSLISLFDTTLFVKPQTFMNSSGFSIARLISFYKVDLKNVYVCHDDADLEIFKIKLQWGANSAGHHGIEDIITQLGTKDFWRIRIGVGRPTNVKFDLEEWVLTDFDQNTLQKLPDLVDEVAEILHKQKIN